MSDQAIVKVEAEAEPEPLRLIQQAISAGYRSDDLKVLFELYNRRTADLARAAFHHALVEAQKAMPVVVRDGQNPQTKSTYARLETVQKQCKAVWGQHGFALSFAEDECPLEGYKRTICDVRHIAGHCERYWIDLPLDGIGPKGNAIGGMNRLQGAVSTGSYGQRILTCRIFDLVIADTDQDGQIENLDTLLADEVEEMIGLIKERGYTLARVLAYANQLQGQPATQLGGILRANFAKIMEAMRAEPTKARTA